MEIREYIESLRQNAEKVKGDLEHTTFTSTDEIRDDVLECIPDTIITTIKLSAVITDLLKEKWQLIDTRPIQNIECAEFMMMAPFALRVAVLGTNFCPAGEYIMFRAGDGESSPESVLVRQGIQG